MFESFKKIQRIQNILKEVFIELNNLNGLQKFLNIFGVFWKCHEIFKSFKKLHGIPKNSRHDFLVNSSFIVNIYFVNNSNYLSNLIYSWTKLKKKVKKKNALQSRSWQNFFHISFLPLVSQWTTRPLITIR